MVKFHLKFSIDLSLYASNFINMNRPIKVSTSLQHLKTLYL